MKKQLLLTLFLLYSSLTLAMDNSSLISRISSVSSRVINWLLHNQKSQDSELITNLRTSKENFANQLELHVVYEIQKKYRPANIQLFTIEYIKDKPAIFLSYCYHQKLHKTEYLEVDEIVNLEYFFNQCLQARINGYSALGAAMIGDAEFPEERQKFIQKLLRNNFIPTIKDMQLAELIFYDEIANYHEMLLLLLKNNASSRSHVLPQDIRLQIIRYIIQLLKEETWPLSKNKFISTKTTDNDLSNGFNLIKYSFSVSCGF